ncbi:hypothetical protein B0H17DRAFT_1177240 [Mycena rosella]|uniref:Uncharacterized protein n=1 Tax=Mycena rosella TaxID=1033263 RepID=A0AAD7GQ29_MYCRO|nr:hypothetical protein B0H17DRAFT_1177240 [Mycena rosella]
MTTVTLTYITRAGAKLKWNGYGHGNVQVVHAIAWAALGSLGKEENKQGALGTSPRHSEVVEGRKRDRKNAQSKVVHAGIGTTDEDGTGTGTGRGWGRGRGKGTEQGLGIQGGRRGRGRGKLGDGTGQRDRREQGLKIKGGRRGQGRGMNMGAVTGHYRFLRLPHRNNNCATHEIPRAEGLIYSGTTRTRTAIRAGESAPRGSEWISQVYKARAKFLRGWFLRLLSRSAPDAEGSVLRRAGSAVDTYPHVFVTYRQHMDAVRTGSAFYTALAHQHSDVALCTCKSMQVNSPRSVFGVPDFFSACGGVRGQFSSVKASCVNSMLDVFLFFSNLPRRNLAWGARRPSPDKSSP